MYHNRKRKLDVAGRESFREQRSNGSTRGHMRARQCSLSGERKSAFDLDVVMLVMVVMVTIEKVICQHRFVGLCNGPLLACLGSRLGEEDWPFEIS